jgi:hypothetical protein
MFPGAQPPETSPSSQALEMGPGDRPSTLLATETLPFSRLSLRGMAVPDSDRSGSPTFTAAIGAEINVSAPPGAPLVAGVPLVPLPEPTAPPFEGVDGAVPFAPPSSPSGEPDSGVALDPGFPGGPRKMLTIVSESGEVLHGMVTSSVRSAITRNIARQKRDYSKTREAWIQRVIKAHLTLAILMSVLSLGASTNFARIAPTLHQSTDWSSDLEIPLKIAGNSTKDLPKLVVTVDDKIHMWRQRKATGFPFHESFPDPEINLPEDEFSNQTNTDWSTYLDERLYAFNRWIWLQQKEMVQVTWWTALKVVWRALKAMPPLIASVFSLAFYDLPILVWKQQNSVIFVFNLVIITALLYLTYAMVCAVAIGTARCFSYTKRFSNNVGITMREFPWMVYNLVVFWRAPVEINGCEDVLTAKFEQVDGRKVVSVYLRGKKIHTLNDPDNGTSRKEMAFPSNPAKKIEKVNNDILRTQVMFYFNDKTTNHYSFVGQGTIVKITDLHGKERLYVVTATHVYVCASHFSAANSHGSAGQRFVEVPEARIKAPCQKDSDLDFCCFEIDQSKMSKAACPTYPTLVPAVSCSRTSSSWLVSNDVLEAVGCGQPDGDGLGFYRTTGKATTRPTENPYVFGHVLSTKHGWSGCGLFRRATNGKLHLAGIHTGRIRDENAFILMEEMHEMLEDDNFFDVLSAKVNESPTRHNRLFDEGGRQGTAARDRRFDKATYAAGTGDYSKFTSNKDAVPGAAPLRISADEERGLDEISEKEEEAKKKKKVLDLKQLLEEICSDSPSDFQSPAEKPPTGQGAVEKKPNISTLERAISSSLLRKQSESSSNIQDGASTPAQELTQSKSSAPVQESSTEPESTRKGTQESVNSSKPSSRKPKKSTSTQTAPKKQSSPASLNTIPENTPESDFQPVKATGREKLLQDTTSKLASLGGFPSLQTWAESASKKSLKEIGAILSKVSTQSPPQDIPTDSSSQTTTECSPQQKETSRIRFGNVSKRSYSPVLRTRLSGPALRLGRGGLRGR